MHYKLLTIILTSFILGGCTLNISSDQAATDTRPALTPSPKSSSPTDNSKDSAPLSQDTEVDSLQQDIDNTVILEEDFSDL